MPHSTGLLPRLWRAFHPVSRLAPPYAVACPACGFTLRGARRSRHQVLPCPRCHHQVFILPRSPFAATSPGGTSAPIARPRRFWLMPALAGTMTLLVLVLLFLALMPYLARQNPNPPPDPAKQLRQQIEAGRQALTEGRFNQAMEILDRCCKQARANPRWLTEAERRDLYQGFRQAELLDGLLSLSLQELLAQALAAGRDDEWRARFRKDYHRKAVVFDDLLRLDGEGQPVLGFTTVRANEISARLAVEELRLLAQLPLGQPVRVIFGARLQDFAREPGGNWVIRFEPDSGVLLTDEEAFRALAPLLLDRDDSIPRVLKRQREWVEKLPGP